MLRRRPTLALAPAAHSRAPQNTRGMDQVAADQNIAVIPPWSEEEGSDGEAPAKQLPPGGRQ